jgi:hypothetical protein
VQASNPPFPYFRKVTFSRISGGGSGRFCVSKLWIWDQKIENLFEFLGREVALPILQPFGTFRGPRCLELAAADFTATRREVGCSAPPQILRGRLDLRGNSRVGSELLDAQVSSRSSTVSAARIGLAIG